eukprot:504428-Prymnesium_polylepis.1
MVAALPTARRRCAADAWAMGQLGWSACPPHCTAVPHVAEGDCLVSLFCSLPSNVRKPTLGPGS